MSREKDIFHNTEDPVQLETGENSAEKSTDTESEATKNIDRSELTRRKFLELMMIGLVSSSTELGCALNSLIKNEKKIEEPTSTEYKNPPEVVERGEYHFVGDHNWALYAWGNDVLEEKIPATGNTLVHIDAHNDSGLEEERHFYLSQPLLEKWSDPKIDKDEKLRLLHEETRKTSIGKFITTAAMLGITDKMYWVRPRYEKPINQTRHFELSKTQNWSDQTFVDAHEIGSETDIDQLKNQGRKIFTIHEITADQIEAMIKDDPSVIFDIDLDYLGSYEQGAPLRIDCTEDNKITKTLCEKHADERDENNTITNPFRPYGHRPTVDEYINDIAELQGISSRLGDKKISKTVALSPDFIQPDMSDDIVQKFFNDGKNDQLPKY